MNEPFIWEGFPYVVRITLPESQADGLFEERDKVFQWLRTNIPGDQYQWDIIGSELADCLILRVSFVQLAHAVQSKLIFGGSN